MQRLIIYTFKYEKTKNIHKEIAHGSLKIFCCFFNNGMACQYEKECIYLHEESGLCKYGEDCERQNCMYQHKRVAAIKSAVENENIQDVIDASDDDPSDEEKNETEDMDSETDGEEDTERIDQTFVNPSQSDDGNTDEEIKSDEQNLSLK